MNNDRLNLGVVVPPGNDPPVPLDNIIPAYQQSCHCCTGGDGDDFGRAMIQTVNAAPGGVIKAPEPAESYEGIKVRDMVTESQEDVHRHSGRKEAMGFSIHRSMFDELRDRLHRLKPSRAFSTMGSSHLALLAVAVVVVAVVVMKRDRIMELVSPPEPPVSVVEMIGDGAMDSAVSMNLGSGMANIIGR